MTIYTDDEVSVMLDFLDHGAWLIANGTAENPKAVLHKWGERGLTELELVEYAYGRPNATISVVLSSVGMVMVDLDNPYELTQSGQSAFGASDRKGYQTRVKQQWRALPEPERLGIINIYDRHAKTGPPHIFEISVSKAGAHWLYRCPDGKRQYDPHPNIEIYGNKKPCFITDWLALEGFFRLPLVSVHRVRKHWSSLQHALDTRAKPKPKPMPPLELDAEGNVCDYDFEAYIEASQSATAGRNNTLNTHIYRAAQLGVAGEVEKAKQNARLAGLGEDEIERTARSAWEAGLRNPDLEYRKARRKKGYIQ